MTLPFEAVDPFYAACLQLAPVAPPLARKPVFQKPTNKEAAI